jgi:Rod binding domain-containing protein
VSPLKIQPAAGAPPALVKPAVTGPAAGKAAAGKAVDPALKRLCGEFETAFLHQVLQAAKIGGKEMEHGYGAMAVDALAGGIQAGGGLGLARAIERALERQHEAPVAHAPAPHAPAPQAPGALRKP